MNTEERLTRSLTEHLDAVPAPPTGLDDAISPGRRIRRTRTAGAAAAVVAVVVAVAVAIALPGLAPDRAVEPAPAPGAWSRLARCHSPAAT